MPGRRFCCYRITRDISEHFLAQCVFLLIGSPWAEQDAENIVPHMDVLFHCFILFRGNKHFLVLAEAETTSIRRASMELLLCILPLGEDAIVEPKDIMLLRICSCGYFPFPQQFLYFLPLPQGQGAFLAGLPETVEASPVLPFSTAHILASGSR